MTPLFLRSLATITAIIFLCSFSYAQAVPGDETENTKREKPYKILTSGKQVTVKSTKEIKTVMVWTSTGHRIIEEKSVNATSFSFRINLTEKVFFIMIQFEGSKPFTEKIGVQ
jgi:hypothetical protein